MSGYAPQQVQRLLRRAAGGSRGEFYSVGMAVLSHTFTYVRDAQRASPGPGPKHFAVVKVLKAPDSEVVEIENWLQQIILAFRESLEGYRLAPEMPTIVEVAPPTNHTGGWWKFKFLELEG